MFLSSWDKNGCFKWSCETKLNYLITCLFSRSSSVTCHVINYFHGEGGSGRWDFLPRLPYFPPKTLTTVPLQEWCIFPFSYCSSCFHLTITAKQSSVLKLFALITSETWLDAASGECTTSKTSRINYETWSINLWLKHFCALQIWNFCGLGSSEGMGFVNLSVDVSTGVPEGYPSFM